MPEYTYKNPITKEEISVIQSMKEDHIYRDKNGTLWDRVFFAPQASIDTKWDEIAQEISLRKPKVRGGRSAIFGKNQKN